MKAQINSLLVFGHDDARITVPVGIASAVSEANEISFKVLHEKCRTPVSMKTVANEAKKNGTAKGASQVTPPVKTPAPMALAWCETCEVEATETVRGFEFTKEQYVVFTDTEIDQAKGQRDPVIRLTKFVKRDEILPTWINKHYFLIPNAHVNEAYGVLYQALAETKTMGIGKQSLWGKESPCAIYANQDYEHGVLMMVLLHCREDLVEPDFSSPIPKKESKKLTKDLIAASIASLTSVDLSSTSRQRMNSLVEAKINGIELPVMVADKEPDVTLDIDEMLRRSLELLATT